MVGRNTTDPFYAWCPELNRIVTVKEVWEFSFGERDKRINKPLTLLCPVKILRSSSRVICKNFDSYCSLKSCSRLQNTKNDME